MNRFIDLEQDKDILYDNIYMNEYKIIIKMPLYNAEGILGEIKHDTFDLAKSKIFIPYE
ncbi:MAG: hypothetical protein ACFFAS_05080 [Promethearchaeota archaeon]